MIQFAVIILVGYLQPKMIYQCYFILMIYSGFRRGKMCGLTWNDIDFDNHIITVNKALYQITDKGALLDTPKTSASNRSLKLGEEVFAYLRRLQDFYEQLRFLKRRRRHRKL